MLEEIYVLISTFFISKRRCTFHPLLYIYIYVYKYSLIFFTYKCIYFIIYKYVASIYNVIRYSPTFIDHSQNQTKKSSGVQNLTQKNIAAQHSKTDKKYISLTFKTSQKHSIKQIKTSSTRRRKTSSTRQKTSSTWRIKTTTPKKTIGKKTEKQPLQRTVEEHTNKTQLRSKAPRLQTLSSIFIYVYNPIDFAMFSRPANRIMRLSFSLRLFADMYFLELRRRIYAIYIFYLM